jgi:hypothetical protein
MQKSRRTVLHPSSGSTLKEAASHWYQPRRLNGITTRKISIWIHITMNISNLISTKQKPSSKDNIRSASQKFPVLYRTTRLFTVFTRVRHWTKPWVRWAQSTSSQLVSRRAILLQSFNIRNCILPSGFTTKTVNPFMISTCVLHVLPISFPMILISIRDISDKNSLCVSFSHLMTWHLAPTATAAVMLWLSYGSPVHCFIALHFNKQS